ncbi:MAG: hypothetical protein FWD44_05995 [Oscillospiraceae bacterium]|nr:hypothetical protein [Oscillospiraceae bacterium]
MALMICRECNGKVSSDADCCPHCGHKSQLEEDRQKQRHLENLEIQIENLEINLKNALSGIEEKKIKVRDYQFELTVVKKEDREAIKKRIDWWNGLLMVDMAEEKALHVELKELKDALKRSKM